MQKEPLKIVTKNGTVTGKTMYKVQGDPNGWHKTPQEAISVHNRAKAWWDNYYRTGGSKPCKR